MKQNQQSNPAYPKVKIIRYIIPLVLIGMTVGLLLVKMTTIESTLKVIKSMPLWLTGLAILTQVGSYLGSGFVLSAIMKLGHSKLSTGRGALITMASASIGLVAGGWVSSSATTYFWVAKNQKGEGMATLTGILPGLYNMIILTIVTIIGMIYLLLNHNLSQVELITYSITLGLILLLIMITIYAFKSQERVDRFTTALIKFINRFSKRKIDAAAQQEKIGKFFSQIKNLSLKQWAFPGWGALANIVFDIFTLYLCFRAAGYPIKLGILISGYGLAFLIGRIAFFMPGGIGVIEGGMTAIFSSLGIAGHFSVVAVLSYRLVSFWLPILLGFLVMIYLQRTSGPKRTFGDSAT